MRRPGPTPFPFMAASRAAGAEGAEGRPGRLGWEGARLDPPRRLLPAPGPPLPGPDSAALTGKLRPGEGGVLPGPHTSAGRSQVTPEALLPSPGSRCRRHSHVGRGWHPCCLLAPGVVSLAWGPWAVPCGGRAHRARPLLSGEGCSGEGCPAGSRCPLCPRSNLAAPLSV